MSLSSKIANAVYSRDGWQCRSCRNRAGLHPHHVIYKSHGGEDRLDNLITLCNSCHIEGVHGGRLILEVLDVLVGKDVRVKFTRKGNWKPT